MIYRMAIVLMVIASAAFAACGGGDSTTSGNGSSVAGHATAATDATPFDPNILSAIVLGPQDVPLPGVSGTFNPGADPQSYSFNTVYGGGSLQVQSSVGRISDPATRTSNFDRLRRSIAAIVKSENSYAIAGADRAFVYENTSPPISTGLAFKGEFYVLVEMLSQDKTRVAEATDRATLDKYMNLVFSRLVRYLDDPASLTPVVEAEKFGDNATASAVAAMPPASPTIAPAATP